MAEKYIQVPPDSTGKKVHVVQFNDGVNDIDQPVYLIADGNGNYQNLLRVGGRGAAYIRFTEGNPNIDAGGMISTSSPKMNGSLFPWYNDESYISENFTTVLSGSNSSVDLSNNDEPLMIFTTDTPSGSIVQMTTNKYISPSTSVGKYYHFVILIGDSGKDGVVRRWGSYDNESGAYFELNGTDLYAVIRSNITGSPTNEKIHISSWDDPLDGTGFSGYNIDISKIQVWWMDSSVHGTLRFGVYANDGARITVLIHSPVNNKIYTEYKPLPLRLEQFNTNVAPSLSQMKVGPVYVSSIGGSSAGEYKVNSDMIHASKNINSNEWTPICSMKMGETFGGKDNRITFVPLRMDTHTYGSSGGFAIRIKKNCDLTGATWDFEFVNPNGPIKGDVDATSCSGGRLVASFICNKDNDSEDLTNYFSYEREYLVRNAPNTDSSSYTIEAKMLVPGDTTDLWFSMVWREYE